MNSINGSENADVTRVRLACAGQVSLNPTRAFLAVCKTSQSALLQPHLEKELVFKNLCSFLRAFFKMSKNLKKNRKCNGELEKACNCVNKHLLLILTEKIAQAQLTRFKT